MIIKTSVNHGLLIIAFFLAGLSFIIFLGGNDFVASIFFILSVTFVITAFITVLKTVTIACFENDNIELYFTRKNKNEVIEFAKQVIASGNSFLLNKYGRIDRDLPIGTQLSNLEFLKNREIISEELFESLKNQLLGRENKSSIGFNQ